MDTVANIVKSKADPSVYTIAPSTSVYDAMQLMADKRIGALVVTDGERIVGIVTERDYARKIVLKNRASKKTPVRDIMSTAVIHVGLEHTTDDCIRLMGENKLRHLPVLDGERLVGMISIRDLLDEIIADRKFQVGELEQMVREKADSRDLSGQERA